MKRKLITGCVIGLLLWPFMARAIQYFSYLHNPQVPSASGQLNQQSGSNLFTGSATYTLQIPIPPGTNHLQPNVAIFYDSQRTKMRPTVFGTGWSFTQSAIQRDVEHTPSNTQDDTYILILDGIEHELIYNANENLYHTKIESFLKIQRVVGGENDYGDYWLLTTKSGTKYRFGFTQNSELVSNQHDWVWRWNLDRIQDTNNNTITYTYAEDPHAEDSGTSYLTEITYNNDNQRRITFNYEEDSRPDIWKMYEQGHQITESRRVHEIEVRLGQSLVRKFRFVYEVKDVSSRSFLTQVTEIGSDGLSELPSTTFQYYDAMQGWQSLPRGTAWSLGLDQAFSDDRGRDLGARLVDVNRDGLVDLIKGGERVQDQATWINTGSGWIRDETWDPPLAFITDDYEDEGVRFAELNGDGWIDILQGNDRRAQSWINTGAGWQQDNRWAPPLDARFVDDRGGVHSEGVELADLNGDGLTDLIKANEDTHNSDAAWINMGSGWAVDQQHWRIPANVTFVADEISEIDYRDHNGRRRELEVDYNGSDQGTRIIDINGDGLPDLLQGTENEDTIWYNTGERFTVGGHLPNVELIDEESVSIESQGIEVDNPVDDDFVVDCVDQGVRFGDLNGDGLTDILQAYGSNCNVRNVWVDTGNSRWVSRIQNWSLNSDMCFTERDGRNLGTRIADLNGDGIIDLMRRTSECNGSSCNGVWVSRNSKGYLLQEVRTSSGAIIQYDYQKSVELDNTGDNNQSDLGFNVWVVSQITRHNGMENYHQVSSTTNYAYTRGSYDYQNKKFRGFGTAEEHLPNETTIKHFFHQNEARLGKEYRTEIYDEDTLLKQTEYSWGENLNHSVWTSLLLSMNIVDHSPNGNGVKTTSIIYDYNDYGNVTTIQHNGDTRTQDDNWAETYTYTYNPQRWMMNKPKTHTIVSRIGLNEAPLAQELFYYDNHTLNEAPERGNLTRHRQQVSDNNFVESRYQFDAFGNIVTTIDPNNHETHYIYDPSHTLPISERNALNQIIQKTFDLGTGNVLSETDPNHFTLSYEYDEFGRKIKEILPLDNSQSPSIAWIYDFDGQAPEKIKTIYKVSNPSNNATWNFYDGFNNVIQTKKEADNQRQIVLDYRYDEFERLISASNPYFVNPTENYSEPDLDVSRSHYNYDKLNRLVRSINPDATQISINYGLWQKTISDENGGQTTYYLDAYNRIVQIDEHDANRTYSTLYRYNLNDQITEISDSQGHESSFSYDDIGRKVRISDPNTGSWSYDYDANSNLVRQTDSTGNQITMTYDALNRMTSKTSGDQNFRYTYDQNTIGTLSTVSSPFFQVSYEYDQRLRVVRETKVINEQEFITNQTYDGQNRITQETTNDHITDYSYGKQGLTHLNHDVAISYNEFNQPTSRTYTNGLESLLDYDLDSHRLIRIQTLPFQDIQYTYDNTGNTLTIDNPILQTNTSMQYDHLNRLVRASQEGEGHEFITRYQYDSISNMVQANIDNESIEFTYGDRPIHSPQTVNAPQRVPQCEPDERLVDNVCVPLEGCNFNNPPCADHEECIDNNCVVQVGCDYDNPHCEAQEECINNQCVRRPGCNFNNPSCEANEDCVNNQCVLREDCDPACDELHACLNHQCVLRNGCDFNNPPCENNAQCLNNICVPLDPQPNDQDGDEVPDEIDNCLLTPNRGQRDSDHDGVGDACDNSNNIDRDGDGIPNEEDNCPGISNLSQEDRDHDGLGDPCDPEIDGDGLLNDDDNCPYVANPNQTDNDNDGMGNVCDPDKDGDGIQNDDDNCPSTPNANQADQNRNGLGDACEIDLDWFREQQREHFQPFWERLKQRVQEVWNRWLRSRQNRQIRIP